MDDLGQANPVCIPITETIILEASLGINLGLVDTALIRLPFADRTFMSCVSLHYIRKRYLWGYPS